MPLIDMKSMLQDAYAGKYAVGGFDGYNCESIQAIAQTGLEKRSPLLAIAAASEYALLGAKMTAALAGTIADYYGVGLCLHLDHGQSFEEAAEAIEAGFRSVMIDGSQRGFEDNVALTKKVVDYAHARGVCVEAELGALTRVDDIGHEGNREFRQEHTDPAKAAEFVERTGCDFLAVSIGNAHGLYTQAPELDFACLERIRDATGIPLVLHGGSGTPEDQLRRAVSLGIAKVNVASEIAKTYNSVYIPLIQEGKTWWASAKCQAVAATRGVIGRWMDVLGSSGKGTTATD